MNVTVPRTATKRESSRRAVYARRIELARLFGQNRGYGGTTAIHNRHREDFTRHLGLCLKFLVDTVEEEDVSKASVPIAVGDEDRMALDRDQLPSVTVLGTGLYGRP